MTAYLLDVNVLIALLDRHHVHSVAAHHWFSDVRDGPWATCPITENGFVRVVSHPAYRAQAIGTAVAVETLRVFCARDDHVFWPDSISIRSLLNDSTIVSSAQITDGYLLGLAAGNGGRLATFDRNIPAHAVVDGTAALELLEGA